MNRLMLTIGLLFSWPGQARTDDDLPATPWDRPAFTAQPEAILKALPELPSSSDQAYQLLLHERDCRLALDGTRTLRTRMMYRVVSRLYFDQGLGAVRQEWSPWFQQRPQIQARVITPDGQVHELDPSTIGEAPAATDELNVYTDDRILQAPLPAVRLGAVVEQVTIQTDMRAFCEQGIVQSFLLSSVMDGGVCRVRVDMPQDLPIQHRVIGTDLEAVAETADGRQTLTWESRSSEPLSAEVLAPRDLPQLPYVLIATGRSWNDVAQFYHQQIGDRFQFDALPALVEQILDDDDSRRQKIEKLLAYQQSNIRYTGVEFGSSSIVPQTAAQTLRRKYGDCKDQSVVLLGLLQAAGIKAHAALLSAGSSHPVNPELPALNWFNHAIVHVPGSPELWIDPVARFHRLGELPTHDQNRLALIVAPRTQQLVRTPIALSSDNRRQEEFEVRLSELKPAQMTYQMTLSGALAAGSRNSLASSPLEQNRDQWKRLVADETGCQSLDLLEFSDPHNLETPLSMNVRGILDENSGWASETAAMAVLNPERVLRDVPWYLIFLATESTDEDAPLREHPIAFPQVSLRKTHYRIVPPPGFEIVKVPEGDSQQFGPASFVSEYRLRDDASLDVDYRFDTGHGQLSPQQWQDFQKWYRQREQSGRNVIALQFQQVAARHLREGNLPEAFKQYRKLLAAHKDNALYHAQYAAALLEAGFAAAALTEAQQGGRLQPDLAVAHRVLGQVLFSDDLGRHGITPIDRDKAEQALREAIRRAPDEIESRWVLIDLLERNRQGNRYAADSRMDEALPVYQQLWPLMPDDPNLERAYALNLLFSGKIAELDQWLRSRPANLNLFVIQVAGRASDEDAAAAIRLVETQRLTADQRRQVLATAGDWITLMRRYPLAAELTSAALEGLPPGTQPQWEASLEMLRRLRPLEEVRFPEDDPRAVVQGLLAEVWAGEQDPDKLAKFFTSSNLYPSGRSPLIQGIREIMATQRQFLLDNYQTAASLGDRVSRLRFEVTKTTPAFSIVTTSGEDGHDWVWYVVSEQGTYHIQVVGNEEAGLGNRALSHLDRDEPRLAEAWLEAAYEFQKQDVGWLNQFSGSPFGRLWYERPKTLDDAFLRMAACALVSRADTLDPSVIRTLEQAREKHSGRIKLQVERALIGACLRSDPSKVLEIADRLCSQFPNEREPFMARTNCLVELKRWDEIRTLCTQVPTKQRLARMAPVYLAFAATDEEDLSSARRILNKALEEQPDRAFLLTILAKLALRDSQDLSQVLSQVQSQSKQIRGNQAIPPDLLAALHAAVGQTDQAQEWLYRYRDYGGSDSLDSAGWYVVGRRAESLGLNDVAADAYRRVLPDPDTFQPISYHTLAQRQLLQLQPKP